MKLIVGLGNPGAAYAGTRHNAGRELVESLAKREALKFKAPRGLGASVALGSFQGEEVVFATLKCFMNLSGEPVARLVRRFQIEPAKELLVAVDDAALPFGKLRLRSRGSDGGHNGLKSVQEHLGTQGYARLRLGIGPSDAGELQEFVLRPFGREEKASLKEFFLLGYEACRLWTTLPSEKAMNLVNAC